jgi:hypothetical protein
MVPVMYSRSQPGISNTCTCSTRAADGIAVVRHRLPSLTQHDRYSRSHPGFSDTCAASGSYCVLVKQTDDHELMQPARDVQHLHMFNTSSRWHSCCHKQNAASSYSSWLAPVMYSRSQPGSNTCTCGLGVKDGI